MPHSLTICRVATIPLFCTFWQHSQCMAAVIVFLLMMLNDVFDGRLARQLHVASRAGAYLDATADFLVVLSIFLIFVMQGLYAGFILIWAPVGEELFYRGYMQGVLRQSRSFATAALISAAFFGLRHATHLCFLWPDVPWIASASWVVSTFIFGLLMSYVYEQTHSLYPVILVHLGVNMVELTLS